MRDPRTDPRPGDIIRYALAEPRERRDVLVEATHGGQVTYGVLDATGARVRAWTVPLEDWPRLNRARNHQCLGWTTCDGETVEIREETW
jgi:hypothetical protein